MDSETTAIVAIGFCYFLSVSAILIALKKNPLSDWPTI
jgi:hypothetical protein